MTPGRVAFVVLAVIGVVFVLLAGVGLTRDDAGADPEGRAWLDAFAFGSAPAVEAADLGANCFNAAAGRFGISGFCQVTIGPSGDRARLMELAVPEDGTAVQLRLEPADSDGVAIKKFDLEAGKAISASVGAAGGSLSLFCLGAAPNCVVDLVE